MPFNKSQPPSVTRLFNNFLQKNMAFAEKYPEIASAVLQLREENKMTRKRGIKELGSLLFKPEGKTYFCGCDYRIRLLENIFGCGGGGVVVINI